MTLDLMGLSESMGWKLTIEVDPFEKTARFFFSADGKETVVHPDVFSAATWLSGYALGIERPNVVPKGSDKRPRDQ